MQAELMGIKMRYMNKIEQMQKALNIVKKREEETNKKANQVVP
jgi:hypothetical protein